jgi:hypothetical protein
MTDLTGNTFFEGPAGRIEAILKEPAASVSRIAVVCHPHPLFGGTMHNKVVYRIAKAFEKSALRHSGLISEGRGAATEYMTMGAASRMIFARPSNSSKRNIPTPRFG